MCTDHNQGWAQNFMGGVMEAYRFEQIEFAQEPFWMDAGECEVVYQVPIGDCDTVRDQTVSDISRIATHTCGYPTLRGAADCNQRIDLMWKGAREFEPEHSTEPRSHNHSWSWDAADRRSEPLEEDCGGLWVDPVVIEGKVDDDSSVKSLDDRIPARGAAKGGLDEYGARSSYDNRVLV